LPPWLKPLVTYATARKYQLGVALLANLLKTMEMLLSSKIMAMLIAYLKRRLKMIRKNLTLPPLGKISVNTQAFRHSPKYI